MLAGVLYFIFRILNDGILMFCVYEKDIEGNGIMTDLAVRYTYIGVIMSHFFLIFSCFMKKQYLACIMNLILLVCTIYLYILFSRSALNMDHILDMCPDIDQSEPNPQEIDMWITHYTHPIMKLNKYFYAYRKNFENPSHSRSLIEGDEAEDEADYDHQDDSAEFDPKKDRIQIDIRGSHLPTEGKETRSHKKQRKTFESNIKSEEISLDHKLTKSTRK